MGFARERFDQPGADVADDAADDALAHARRALAEAEAELAALRERFAALRAEQAEQLGVISHEVRTPLTVIAGYNRLLLSGQAGPLTDEQREFVRESDRSCRRLDDFIEHVLEGAGHGRVESRIEPVEASLRDAIDGVGRSLRPLLEARALSLETALEAGADRAWFDPTRIAQVLTNLLGNAIKYSKPGGTIRIGSRALPGGGRDFVEIAVVDQGPGVSDEERERIFEPYVRGDAAGAGGLGLGLSICKRIVEGHGGAIGVSDPPGGGSCFAFTLRAAKPAEVS